MEKLEKQILTYVRSNSSNFNNSNHNDTSSKSTNSCSNDDSSTTNKPRRRLLLRSVPLLPAQNILLSPSQYETITQHTDLLHQWNFQFQLASSCRRKSHCLLRLNGVPQVCGTVATSQDFLDFLQTLSGKHTDAIIVKPNFVQRVLTSKACRYSIMFGDVLPEKRCERLISQLAECDMSFVCAHGRPSIIPLLDMNLLLDDKKCTKWRGI